MAHQVLEKDTLDDRREVYHLLARLPPAQRVAFLAWACRTATLRGGRSTHPGVSAKTRALARRAERDDSADQRLTLDIFFDCWWLSLQFEFSLDEALNELVRRVQGKSHVAAAEARLRFRS